MPKSLVTKPSCLLRIENISKAFPGVRALHEVSLELRSGEVLALVGENGAGKSTLIKILGGAHRADTGEVAVLGERADIISPADAQQLGISIIYQEFNLIPDLSVRENIFLGREIEKGLFIDEAEEYREVEALFNRLDLKLDPETLCRNLTIAEQQLVEIAKALSLNTRILIMDEPSATLSQQEVNRLFGTINDLKSQGIGIIYISHRLEEVFEIADRVMVLRDGEQVVTSDVTRVSRKELIESMVGRPLEAEFPPKQHKPGVELLRVSELSRAPRVDKVSFSVQAGEVLGFAGLVGAGRTETMRLIFGADAPDSGTIYLRGKKIKIRSPREAIRYGICLLTEDRKNQGLVLIHSVQENFGLPNLKNFSGAVFLDEGRELAQLHQFTGEINIRLASPDQDAGHLSGGNQQKVVLAKWLERNADILIFDEPTRGIDVGAKYEIYQLMNTLAEKGKAIIMISSELPEILGMSDRIIVMRNGRVVGEITEVGNTTQEDIMHLAVE